MRILTRISEASKNHLQLEGAGKRPFNELVRPKRTHPIQPQTSSYMAVGPKRASQKKTLLKETHLPKTCVFWGKHFLFEAINAAYTPLAQKTPSNFTFDPLRSASWSSKWMPVGIQAAGAGRNWFSCLRGKTEQRLSFWGSVLEIFPCWPGFLERLTLAWSSKLVGVLSGFYLVFTGVYWSCGCDES